MNRIAKLILIVPILLISITLSAYALDIPTESPLQTAETKSFWVMIPIINTSTTSWRATHRVRIVITFSESNLIKEIHAEPFEVTNGGKSSHTVTLELSVLYPGSVIYLSFLVGKSEIPEISIDWAEKK